jgi:hypothetical protein
MGLVSPTQSSPGDTIEAADINTPINQLAAVINGSIETANIADSAVSTAKVVDSAVTYTKVAAGFPVQVVGSDFSALATGTTLMNRDDTKPQNTEGDEYMTLAITPKATSHKLVIDAVFCGASSVNTDMIVALFQDSTADAVAATIHRNVTSNGQVTIPLRHIMTAGTTSATTFKIRAGGTNAGTTSFNGNGGTRIFGGITLSSLTIWEYKA